MRGQPREIVVHRNDVCFSLTLEEQESVDYLMKLAVGGQILHTIDVEALEEMDLYWPAHELRLAADVLARYEKSCNPERPWD